MCTCDRHPDVQGQYQGLCAVEKKPGKGSFGEVFLLGTEPPTILKIQATGKALHNSRGARVSDRVTVTMEVIKTG
jgi:hypothetical protein